MKLKVQDLMSATLVLTDIINERRPLPQKGKYRVARMHAKLKPEYDTAAIRKDEMIKAYDTPLMDLITGTAIEGKYQVPADKLAEFNAAWKEIGDSEIEVDVEPIPLDQLDGGAMDGAIQAHELITLGELVRE